MNLRIIPFGIGGSYAAMDWGEKVKSSLKRLEAEFFEGLWLHRLHIQGGPWHILLPSYSLTQFKLMLQCGE